MSSTLGRNLAAITPECPNLSKTINAISLISVVFTIILFMLLVFVLIYNYMQKDETTTDPDGTTRTIKRVSKITPKIEVSKMTTNLAWASSVFALIVGVLNVYGYVVLGRTTKKCINAQ